MREAFWHYWQHADGLGQGLTVLLIAMSLSSWTLIVYRSWFFLGLRRLPAGLQAFWQAPDYQAGLQLLQQVDQHAVYCDMLLSVQNPIAGWGQNNAVQLSRLLRDSLQRQVTRLQFGLTMLATVGATAPFVGLLGTVWGIYLALQNIAEQNTLQIEQLTGPVGEALIMTALGLFVALPAVVAYNLLRKQAASAEAALEGFAYDLQQQFGADSAIKVASSTLTTAQD